MLDTVRSPRRSVSRRLRGLLPGAALIVPMLALWLAAAPAMGQAVKAIEPRHVVVVEANAPLKAGPASVHYAVAILKQGQVLRADGETSDDPVFLRVEYPVGVPVFVKTEEASLEKGADGKEQIRLTAASRLRAANKSGGERGHWWFLLPEDALLPEGTVLPVTEKLSTTDGRVYGYLVPAPRDARGFVRLESVAPATDEDLARHRAELAAAAGAPPAGDPATTPPARPDPVAPAPAPAPTPAVTPAPQPQPEAPAPTPVPTPVEPAVEPGVGEPAAAEPGIGEQPVSGTPVDPAAEPAAAPTPEVATLESLASLFKQAQAQPIREAELEEVIAEFRRAIEGLGETPEDKSTKEFLGARLELLKLRADLQKSIRAAEQAAGAASERRQGIASEVSALERARSYTVVGRLMPSTVYDGTRLPKMYRVQSVDEAFSRTVAYLIPRADLELDGKLGRVVGIQGETRLDPALRVNIVRPRRVDVLSATPEAAEPAPVSATDAAGGAL